MKKNNRPRVIFLTQTPLMGASARYRVYQYLDFLDKNGIECIVSTGVQESILNRYMNNSNFINKILYYSSIFFKRMSELGRIGDVDCVFLQRDILIHSYPIIEKLIALRNKRIIFDFDDVLYLYPSHKNIGFLFRLFWDKGKIERIIKTSKHVIVGNNFLKNYALQFSDKVTMIPTSIDMSLYNREKKELGKNAKATTIGWIGSQGTFGYLKDLFPVFIELAKKFKIELKVVGAYGPQVNGLKIDYRDWNINTEIEDIYGFDIGVMPLTDDEWSKGKSGTKLLQYMAAGIPAIASPVGINTEIIKDGINGFLADSQGEWINKISFLIDNKSLVDKICKEAKRTVEEDYSTKANASKLIKVIKEVLQN